MADVAAAHGSQTAPRSSVLNNKNTPHHGRKRSADEPLEHEQRLSKRFDLLNLVDTNGTRLYIPVAGSSSSSSKHGPSSSTAASAAAIPTPDPLTFIRHHSGPKSHRPRPPRCPSNDDGMQIEDTPHRVYIHDLSAELSDIESDEDTPIFLPDIEKHLSKIPRHVLLGPEPKPTEHNQVVLYNVPASLSVPQERDGVRKAIVEARQRIRRGQGSGVKEVEGVKNSIGSIVGGGMSGRAVNIPSPEADSEAMDID